LGLLARERPAQGLQAECRGHGRVQKNFAERVAEIRAQLAPDTPVEVWFQDEMRVGQKNKLTYRWARKGSRHRAAHDQRTQSTYLFGPVCPERGPGAAWGWRLGTAKPCSSISTRSQPKSPSERTPLSSLIRPDGMALKPWWFRTTSHSCRCRRAHPNSTARKTS